jgi:hypothetical protein
MICLREFVTALRNENYCPKRHSEAGCHSKTFAEARHPHGHGRHGKGRLVCRSNSKMHPNIVISVYEYCCCGCEAPPMLLLVMESIVGDGIIQ